MATKRRKTTHRRTPSRRVASTRRRRRTHATTRRRSHSSRAVGSTVARHRTHRRRRAVGSTINSGNLMKIGEMALGIAAGAAVTHLALRPLEHKLVMKAPMAAKWMGAAEIVIGGLMVLKGKQAIVRNAGVGVMAGGVHTVMKQTHLGLNSPAEHPSVNGTDYVTTRIPIGYTEDMGMGMSLIENDKGPIYTPTVGSIIKNSRKAVRTDVVSGWDDTMGDAEEIDYDLFMPKGYGL